MKTTRSVLLCLLLLAPALLIAAAQAPPSDDFLTGYVTAVLQRELDLPPSSFSVGVRDGIVTVELPGADSDLQSRVWSALRGVQGMSGLRVQAPPPTQPPPTAEEPPGTAPASQAVLKGRAYPEGDVFRPLLADPKQPQFFVSMMRFHSSEPVDAFTRTITMASVGYGGTFGLYRRPTADGRGAYQISLDGALFAQFNMDAPSHDLINADYTVGIPFTFREGPFSMRLRLYHQSSHLGDEYLLRFHPKRVNLSYEAADLLVARDWGPFRGYVGGEYRVDRDPSTLRPAMAHWGLEYRSTGDLFDTARLVAGLDVKHDQQDAWNPSASLRVGLEFGSPSRDKRRLRVFLEGYDGHSPYGQFYQDKVDYFGVAVTFNF